MTILDLAIPVIAAPMAGGPTTPDLVVAASEAGGLGFLAAGYKTPEALADHINDVRSRTDTFGVNLFAPRPVPVDPAAYAAYRERIRADAERLQADVPEVPREDDDAWAAKLGLLVADPVPLVSFTFGIPSAREIKRLRDVGTITAQTVTTADEARAGAEAGVDLLVVQAPAAGGHSGTLSPARIPRDRPLNDLVAEIAATTVLPLIAAGGIMTSADARAALDHGASAVAVGTALLLAPEAGTSAAHRDALLGPDRGPTVMTRAFSGRPARAIPNAFLTEHHEEAPSGYPAIHHLTSPMRKAAAAAGDPEHVNLWAGAGYRQARERPAADTLRAIAAGL
ncbi:nitroalkane oxidase [Nocardioides terrae]|uniref:Propionate 3-nitronate monooxygenase n=1 Tax=Nocardioides terrae TaxID=574651 RepID=A0A1I1F0X7_9ACTN|nr:nitronate monooxygenase [Nocardioides terrae]SFB93079.1 nitroalkane oxidase [Nocardioides terrae]